MLQTNGHGSITVNFSVGAKTNTVELCDIRHAPDAPNNLISMGHLTDKNNTATFTGTSVEFKTRAGVIFAQGQKSGCLYKMKVQVT
jgi:Pol polyprotein, beta-barrel domain